MALSTADEILASLLPEWHKLLQGWAADGSLVAAAQEALLLQEEPQTLRDLVSQWSAGDFRGIPPIALLSSAAMNSAMGAYAISTGTIYLNTDWLRTATPPQRLAVLSEELGHHLDAHLNQSDTPGDEGEVFSALLCRLPREGESIRRSTNDEGALIFSDQFLYVEFAEPYMLPPPRILKADVANGIVRIYGTYFNPLVNPGLEVGIRLYCDGRQVAGVSVSSNSNFIATFAWKKVGQSVVYAQAASGSIGDGKPLVYSDYSAGYQITISSPADSPESDSSANSLLLPSPNTPLISLGVSQGSAEEDGSANFVYTFSRTGSTASPLTVNYTVGGTATLGSDYTGISPSGITKTVAFAAGAATATVTVDPTADTSIEPDETVQLTIAAGAGYTIGTTTVVSGTISNDDPANNAPTDLKLSAISFNENIAAATTIATLGTTDPDSGDTFSYALVAGTGSTDNAAFSIAGNQLKINVSPNFESKSSYSIRLRSTDAAGLSFEKVVALNVNDLPELVAPPQGSTNTSSTSGSISPSSSINNPGSSSVINNAINITGTSNGNASSKALAGSLKLEDPDTKKALPVSGDSAVKTLAQLTAAKPLSDTAKQLLDRYIIKDPSSSSSRKASASDAGFIDFTLKTGSLKSLTAEISLASEVKATAYVKVNPNTGEAYDFTYDPVTGIGAELLDTNKNGLVDSLRIHLQDGGLGDVDGAVNGSIRDPGVLAEAPRTPVYRFYRNGVHFYTTNSSERDSVIANSYGKGVGFADLSANPQAKDLITGGWGYRYEGVAYQALDTQGTALYRFFSPSKGYHFVTTNANEALAVIQNSVGSSYNLSNAKGQKLLDKGWGFQYEETSYKVSTIAQTGMDNPVYRFFNQQKGVHFYSSSMEEAKSVVANSLGAQYATDSWITSTADAIKQNSLSASPTPLASGWGYQFEGVGWYV